MSAFDNFMAAVFPGVVQRRQQAALEQLRGQIAGALEPFGPQQTPFPAGQGAAMGGAGIATPNPLGALQDVGAMGVLGNIETPGLFTKPQISSLAQILTTPGLQEFGGKMLESVIGIQDDKQPSAVKEYKYFKSLSPEQQTQYLNVKRQGYTVKDIGGVPTLVPLLPGQSASPLSTLQSELDAKLEERKAEKAGEFTATQTNKAIDEITKIDSSIRELDDVVRLVGEGANTGPLISRLPSLKSASIELENIRNRLGLQVVGSATFGPLSESELKFALDTALPNLTGPDLVSWAKRKIAAQQKVKTALQEQVQFLSQPGNTRAKWVQQFSAQKKRFRYNPQTGRLE